MRRAVASGAPRLHPRADALFKLGDNLVGDALIDIGSHLRGSLIFGLRLLLQPD